MKNLIQALIFSALSILLFVVKTNAQNVANYTFTQTVGTYTPITSGTLLINAGTDNSSSSMNNIGFTFMYHGVAFTQFGAQSNGYIRLGSISQSFTALSTVPNVIAFANKDGKLGGDVTYKLTGTLPNRVLTIEFPAYSLSNLNTTNTVDAQIKLYETTNVIEIIYGNTVKGSTDSISVGINGATIADNNVRNNPSLNWSASTQGANTTKMIWSTTSFPTSGLIYRYTPPVCSGTPTPGNTISSLSTVCPSINFTLSLQNGSSSLFTYQWQKATDSAFTSPINLGTAATQTTSQTIATYYRCIVTCANGSSSAISTPLLLSMNLPTNCYCVNIPNYIDGYGITNVVMGSISNYNISSSTYQNFTTTQFTNLMEGTTIPIAITLQCNLSHYIYVYIDYNQDGDFTDVNEKKYMGTMTSNTLNGTITIPPGTPLGNTGMRIIAIYNNTFGNPCDNNASFNFANVEDYKVKIIVNNNCSGTPTPGNTLSTTSSICPNSTFTLSLQNPPITGLVGYTYQWQKATNSTFTSPINIGTSVTHTTSQTTATYYRCIVTCANGNVTGTSAPILVGIDNTSNCCTGSPIPGNTISSVSTICPNTNFTLSLQNTIIGSNVNYQWQKANNIGFTSPTNIGTSVTQIISQTVATYYRCIVTCSSGPSTVISTPVFVGMNTVAIDCYCIPNTTTVMGFGVTNVEMGSLSNPNLSTNYYQNFTTTTPITNLVVGTNEPIKVTLQIGNPNVIHVYIDFNQDGDFYDANEMQYLGTSNYKSLYMLNNYVSIPSNAVLGNTRMRIVCQYIDYYQYNDLILNSTPCIMQDVGNTEDYTVNIVTSNSCSGTPLPGNTVSTVSTACSALDFTLTLQNSMIGTGYTYQWQRSTDSLFTSPINLGTSFFQVTSQTTATYYRCLVTCATGSNTGISNILFVGMNAPTNCYCDNYPNTMDGIGIYNVTLGSLTNTNSSGNDRYQDFTTSTTIPNLIAGTTMNMSVTINTDHNSSCKVYFDFNQDGDFFDANEEQPIGIYPGMPNYVTASNTITIPLNALSGNTRMRVVEFGSNNISLITPCNLTAFANVEDYTVNIIGAVSLNLKVFLQGYYTGTSLMAHTLMNEGINSDSLLCDSITVELHNDITPYATVHSFQGVIATDGLLSCKFPSVTIGNNYYIVVKHRNSIETWSANAVLVSNNMSYDFTTATSKAYGNNMIDVYNEGVFSIYSGDINQDGSIDGLDYPFWENDYTNSAFGYYNTDLNGDGSVDGLDYPFWENNYNQSVFFAVP